MIWKTIIKNEYGIYNKDMSKHSRHYYEQGRNINSSCEYSRGNCTDNTCECQLEKGEILVPRGVSINPKMIISKEELIAKHYPLLSGKKFKEDDSKLDNKEDKIPNYYIGKVYG